MQIYALRVLGELQEKQFEYPRKRTPRTPIIFELWNHFARILFRGFRQLLHIRLGHSVELLLLRIYVNVYLRPVAVDCFIGTSIPIYFDITISIIVFYEF